MGVTVGVVSVVPVVEVEKPPNEASQAMEVDYAAQLDEMKKKLAELQQRMGQQQERQPALP